MRSFFLSSMLLFLVNSVSLAQSIQISEVSNTANNGVNEFLVAGHKVNMNKAPDVFSISEIT